MGADTVKDKWIYYEKTWTINDSDIAKLECVALALDKNGMIEACNIKLEKALRLQTGRLLLRRIRRELRHLKQGLRRLRLWRYREVRYNVGFWQMDSRGCRERS